jgi:NodT family efflux transporter outer membrane factor (OMF) lipoprotein
MNRQKRFFVSAGRCVFRCVFLFGVLLLSGCLVGPDFHSPHPAVPAAFANATAPGPERAADECVDEASLASWWLNFQDDELTRLVARARENNLDLKIAETRLLQARAQRSLAVAGLLPTVDVSSSYRRSGSKSGSRSLDVPDSLSGIGRGSGEHSTAEAGFDAQWELDFFGKYRREYEAADAELGASREDLRDVLVTLTADVAMRYFDIRELEAQLAISRKNVETLERTAELTERRQQGGFVNGLDAANAKAQLASSRSALPQVEAELNTAKTELALLLGIPTADLQLEPAAVPELPAVPDLLSVGVPSQLLRRRPDIRRAEAQLHAETARVGAAVADLFPRFSISGLLSWQGSTFAALLDGTNRSWSIGPGLSWPVFDGGRVTATIEFQQYTEQQALLVYRQAVLAALRDVENALTLYTHESQRQSNLQIAVEQSETAEALAEKLYRAGSSDYLNVLAAQRGLYSTRLALLQSRRDNLSNIIALYKALGGGWDTSRTDVAAEVQDSPAG